MNYHCFKKKVLLPMVVLPAMLVTVMVQAQEPAPAPAPVKAPDTSVIDKATAKAAEAFKTAKESQARINKLSDQADEMISDYKDQAKIVDGLEVYNAQMRKTIAEQEKTIKQYDASIAEVAELQRQIAPLMERMMTSLEQFVDLDIPFKLDDRKARLQQIRETFNDSSVNVAEKFRLVLNAYEQEINYGRSMDNYTGTLQVNGVERDVDFLRVGRIALLYQTSDQTSTGVWDKSSKQFVELGSEYRRPVANGIRMAQKLATTSILELPINAPE
jgi:uncharacterized coiled-coil protein SlyX